MADSGSSLLLYIILGIVQGVLEWLPVSSEGQIVLITTWFSDFSLIESLRIAFWLHFGTMIAAIFYYRDEWKGIVNFTNKGYDYLRSYIVLATIGTAIVGLPIRILVLEEINPEALTISVTIIIGLSLLGTAILLKVSQDQEITNRGLSELAKWEQLLIGMFQGLTIIPGVSRSGTTVSILLLRKVNGEDSFKGSFILAVPATLGAIFLEGLLAFVDDESLVSGINPIGMVIAIILSFIFGIMTITILINFAKNNNFDRIIFIFAAFLLTLGVILLIL